MDKNLRTQAIVDLVIAILCLVIGILSAIGIIGSNESIGLVIGLLLIFFGIFYLYKAYQLYMNNREHKNKNDNSNE